MSDQDQNAKKGSRLQELCEQILDECESNDTALPRLIDMISEDEGLKGEAVSLGLREALSNARCTARARICGRKVGPPPKVYSEEMQKKVQLALGKFYSWPLSTGIILANARRDDLEADIQHNERSAKGLMRNARFLRMIASKLEKSQTVKEVFKEKDLEKLMRQAEQES